MILDWDGLGSWEDDVNWNGIDAKFIFRGREILANTHDQGIESSSRYE